MILSLILASAISTSPVRGFNEPSNVCNTLSEYAFNVMSMRQTNVPLTDVVASLAEGFGKQDAISPDAVGLVLATTAMAYKLPIASTDDGKVKAVVDFSDVVEERCTKAGF